MSHDLFKILTNWAVSLNLPHFGQNCEENAEPSAKKCMEWQYELTYWNDTWRVDRLDRNRVL
jgi:hypothetical protein